MHTWCADRYTRTDIDIDVYKHTLHIMHITHIIHIIHIDTDIEINTNTLMDTHRYTSIITYRI